MATGIRLDLQLEKTDGLSNKVIGAKKGDGKWFDFNPDEIVKVTHKIKSEDLVEVAQTSEYHIPSINSAKNGDLAITDGGVLLYFNESDGRWSIWTELGSGVFQQEGSSEERSVIGKLQDYISILDYIPETEHQLIRNGTSSFDCSSAISEALSFQNHEDNIGSKIFFPVGIYNFSESIYIDKVVTLEGENSGQTGPNSTTLKFPPNTTGIIVDMSREEPKFDSSGTKIINICLNGDRSGEEGDGLLCRSRVFIQGVKIQNFSGNGVTMQSQPGRSNVNGWRIDTCRVMHTGGHGVFVEGIDANAGYGSMIYTNQTGGCGIFDSSLYGNTYVGCHVNSAGFMSVAHYEGGRYICVNPTLATNTEPGTDPNAWYLDSQGGESPFWKEWEYGKKYIVGWKYYTDNKNSKSVFLGCYAEGGHTPPRINRPSVVIGGILADRDRGSGFANTLGGSSEEIYLSRTKFYEDNYTVVHNVSEDTYSSKVIKGDNKLGIVEKPKDGYWAYNHSDLDSREFMRVTTNLSNLNQGRLSPLDGGNVIFPRGVWIGSRYITMSDSKPNSGEFASGDFIININTNNKNILGWRCNTSGEVGGEAEIEPIFIGNRVEIVAQVEQIDFESEVYTLNRYRTYSYDNNGNEIIVNESSAWDKTLKVTDLTINHVVSELMSQKGDGVNLNFLDTSDVVNMRSLFKDTSFNGNIDMWSVFNVEDMEEMFKNNSSFNRDLSGWCVIKMQNEPIDFADGAASWTLPKPQWGTCQ